MSHIKLRVGDTVLVRRGKDSGKTGKVLQVLPRLNKVVVEGVNQVKKNIKPSTKNPRGGITSQTAPLAVANVGIVHPTDAKRSSRIGFKEGKDGKKIRVYRQAGNKEITK